MYMHGMMPAGRRQLDQEVQNLSPLVTELLRSYGEDEERTAGIRRAVLVGYLVGRGMQPAAALGVVPQYLRTVASPPAPAASWTAPESAWTAPEPTASVKQADDLASALEGFLRDQAAAQRFYRSLEESTELPFAKEALRHAREDEVKHYRMLSGLYREVTGRPYQAPPPTPPATYASLREGLVAAIRDELGAYEAYRDQYLKASDPNIRDLFFELMTDEIEHAVRFSTALQLLG